MKTAVVMSRVSSDEQALGYSLSIQEDNLRSYCQTNNISVIHSFREDHSAKNFDRPEFAAFLRYAKQNQGKIDYLLFTTWDRFSRNVQDAYQMIDRLRKMGIQPMAIQQPIDLAIPENKMMLAVYLVIPEIDNDRRSIKIREGSGRHFNQADVALLHQGVTVITGTTIQVDNRAKQFGAAYPVPIRGV
ncbi:MAG: recombinase family protein [Bacteroidia bacterium]|nr:recombinase family protein [Bacteroidia bacterium]